MNVLDKRVRSLHSRAFRGFGHMNKEAEQSKSNRFIGALAGAWVGFLIALFFGTPLALLISYLPSRPIDGLELAGKVKVLTMALGVVAGAVVGWDIAGMRGEGQ
jgi:hypothetical protein